MRIDFCSYELHPVAPLSSRASGIKARVGALIRVHYKEPAMIGYADCFPWPELGDASLSDQLQHLTSGAPTALGARTLAFSRVDAEGRARGESLFRDLPVPESHAFGGTRIEYALTHKSLAQYATAGFRTLKLKLGRDPGSEAKRIVASAGALREHGLRLRLDLNSSLDCTAAGKFLAEIAPLADRLDFIEDPLCGSLEEWRALLAETTIALAWDRPQATTGLLLMDARALPANLVVLKPAVQDPFRLSSKLPRRVVITSYLDHPLGIMHAAWAAGIRNRTEALTLDPTCGLLSHGAYAPTGALAPFLEVWNPPGPTFIPPPGTGAGFDRILADLPWKRLSA